MKPIVLLAALLAALAAADPAAAQDPSPQPTLGTVPGGPGGPMGRGRMMGRGRGMARGPGGGMGMGMCPMILENADKVEVKNLPDGATITITSSDEAAAKRIQKLAEAMRLMHEARTQ